MKWVCIYLKDTKENRTGSYSDMYLFVDAPYKGNLDWGIYVSRISNKLKSSRDRSGQLSTLFLSNLTRYDSQW